MTTIPLLSTVRPLEAHDVTALRTANDHVSFFRDLNRSDPADPHSYIRASAKAKTSPVFGSTDSPTVDRLISMDCRITTYKDERTHPADAVPRAVYVISSPMFNREWLTVAHFVKAGDTLLGHWYVGNDNGHVTDAGLTVDEFRLEVRRPRTRKGVTSHTVHEFLLGYQPTTVHNSARLVNW